MQNADGTPHLTYFDRETQLSFVWDGESPVIEVCHGGYAEPVIDTIVIERTVGIRNATMSRWMEWFRLVCFNYIRLNVKVDS